MPVLLPPRAATWICVPCALKAGAKVINGHVATFHEDKCGVCGKKVTVTEPRDFRWPNEKDL